MEADDGLEPPPQFLHELYISPILLIGQFLVLKVRFELTTFALRERCSTAKLLQQFQLQLLRVDSQLHLLYRTVLYRKDE